jgi:hypothetical protein
LPTTVNAGELIVVYFSTDGDNVSTFPDQGVTWIKLLNLSDSKDIHLSVAYKFAVGDEGGTTITVTTSSNETSAHLSYTVTGHNSSTNAPEISTGVTGASNTPNPDSVTATWGADDNIWFAISANDDDDSITGWPTNYNDNQHQIEAGNAGPTLGVCSYNYNSTDTQDPDPFTIAASEQWAAATMVVQAGPEPTPVLFTQKVMTTTFI